MGYDMLGMCITLVFVAQFGVQKTYLAIPIIGILEDVIIWGVLNIWVGKASYSPFMLAFTSHGFLSIYRILTEIPRLYVFEFSVVVFSFRNYTQLYFFNFFYKFHHSPC